MADDSAALLALYQTAVEMADRTSARRAGANSFFLTLNTALAAVVGIITSARKPAPHGDVPSFDAFGLVVTAIAGIVLAFVWFLLLRYYRRLNAAKFSVINTMERRLPAQPYADEWAILHPGENPEMATQDLSSKGRGLPDRFQRWRRRVKHREASLVEQVIPFVFMGIYAALGIRALIQ